MLLSDLSVHFNSVRKLARLEEVQFMLTHHTSEHFPFLGTNSTLSEMRCRTMFYTSLGRLSVTTSDEHDTMDAELVIRVLQLMSLTDARLPQAGCEKLELAILSFLDQVRKMHSSEQAQKANVYKRLNEVFGLSDEQMLLSFINRKM